MSSQLGSLLDRYHTHLIDEENLYVNYDEASKGSTFEPKVVEEEFEQEDFDKPAKSIDDYILDLINHPTDVSEYDDSILSAVLEMDIEDAFSFDESDIQSAISQTKKPRLLEEEVTESIISQTLELPTPIHTQIPTRCEISMPLTHGSCSLAGDSLEVSFDEPYFGEDCAHIIVRNEEQEDTTALLFKYSEANSAEFFASPIATYTLANATHKISLPYGQTFKPELSSQPKHGFVTLEKGVFTYTPDTDFIGFDQFSYALTDVRGEASSPTTILVKVLDEEKELHISPRVYHIYTNHTSITKEIFDEGDIINIESLIIDRDRLAKKQRLEERKREKHALKLEEMKAQYLPIATEDVENEFEEDLQSYQQQEEIEQINTTLEQTANYSENEPALKEVSVPQAQTPIIISTQSQQSSSFLFTKAINSAQKIFQLSPKDITMRFEANPRLLRNHTIIFELGTFEDFTQTVVSQSVDIRQSNIIGSYVSQTFSDIPAGQYYWRVIVDGYEATKQMPQPTNQAPQVNDIKQAEFTHTPLETTEHIQYLSLACNFVDTAANDELMVNPLKNTPIHVRQNGIVTTTFTDHNGLLVVPQLDTQLELHIDNPNYVTHSNIVFFDGENIRKSLIITKQSPLTEIFITRV
jgi:hypothetical protein